MLTQIDVKLNAELAYPFPWLGTRYTGIHTEENVNHGFWSPRRPSRCVFGIASKELGQAERYWLGESSTFWPPENRLSSTKFRIRKIFKTGFLLAIVPSEKLIINYHMELDSDR